MTPEMTACLANLMNRAQGDPKLYIKTNTELYSALDVATTLVLRFGEELKKVDITQNEIVQALTTTKWSRTSICHILTPEEDKEFFYNFQQKDANWSGLLDALRWGKRMHVCVYRVNGTVNVACGTLPRIIELLAENGIVPESVLLPELSRLNALDAEAG